MSFEREIKGKYFFPFWYYFLHSVMPCIEFSHLIKGHLSPYAVLFYFCKSFLTGGYGD